METEMIFRCFGSHFRSTGNAFQFDRIWSNNQTPHFSENHFRNQFEVNSNAALVLHLVSVDPVYIWILNLCAWSD